MKKNLPGHQFLRGAEHITSKEDSHSRGVWSQAQVNFTRLLGWAACQSISFMRTQEQLPRREDGATKVWESGAAKGQCEQEEEGGGERIPVPEIQGWKPPTWVRARNTFMETSQGFGGLSKYVMYGVPSAYIRSPKCRHLKLRERQEERWWLLHQGPQEEARGGRHVPAPALQNIQCLPRHRTPPEEGLSMPRACEKGQTRSH